MFSNREMDMTSGPLFKKLVICSIPLILTNILQILFNFADVAVVGLFVGDEAVAAVGANSSLINLITGIFIGLSSGASVVLGKCIGSRDAERAHKVVGTSMLLSLVGGVLLLLIGVFGAKTFLSLMNCDVDVIDMATRYLTVYMLGMPLMMLYNFTASVLRAVGDTMRPLIFLLIGGVLNVGLNVFFVAVLGMTVEGVAIATIVSQGLSAVLSIIVLLKSKGYSRFGFKYFRFYKNELKEILRVGLPSGVQGSLFSVSNVIIQSTVNSLGKVVMAANTVSQQVEQVISQAETSIAIANMSFVSQNYGANKPERIRKVVKMAMVFDVGVSLFLGVLFILLKTPLCGIITDSPEVMDYAYIRLTIMCGGYFLGATMEVFSYTMRGLGKSTSAMIISLCGACLFRILWINSFYLLNKTYFMLIISYPISWFLVTAVFFFYYMATMKKLSRNPKTLAPAADGGGEIAETPSEAIAASEDRNEENISENRDTCAEIPSEESKSDGDKNL